MSAIALRDVGCQVRVLERSVSPLVERGAGINLHRSLVTLLAGRAELDLRPLSCPTERQQFLGANSEVLHSEPRPMMFSSWSALFGLLRDHLGSTPYDLGARVVSFSQSTHGVEAHLANGQAMNADMIVFADGIGSRGRELLAPKQKAEYAGYVVWRGCMAEQELEPNERALLDGAHTTCLVDQSHMNMYLVPPSNAQPVAGRRLVNFVWYRNVTAGPALDDLMTDRSRNRRMLSVPPGEVQERILRELREAAGDLLPTVARNVVQKTPQPYLQVIYDVDVDQMAFENACLVGDAACVARPHLGAGTAKAAENAWALADALEDCDGDIANALGCWNATEVELGRNLVRRSRLLGDLLQGGGLQGPDDPAYGEMIEAPLRSEPVP